MHLTPNKYHTKRFSIDCKFEFTHLLLLKDISFSTIGYIYFLLFSKNNNETSSKQSSMTASRLEIENCQSEITNFSEQNKTNINDEKFD